MLKWLVQKGTTGNKQTGFLSALDRMLIPPSHEAKKVSDACVTNKTQVAPRSSVAGQQLPISSRRQSLPKKIK
jgi:hypothetical protein